MGEISDMMLEGYLCECCGVPLEDEPMGIPNYCSVGCARDRGAQWWIKAHKKLKNKKDDRKK